MSQADRPYLTRPLAGVDQALGEGRARQPVELLDQLRERLDRLDPNHPSASPRSTGWDEAPGRDATPDQDVAADPAADQAAGPGESGQDSRPDHPSLRKAGADRSREDQPGDQGAGGSPAIRHAGQPAPAGADGAVNGLGADGQSRVAGDRVGEAAGTDKGERYLPWFAGESGTPWFFEQGFVE